MYFANCYENKQKYTRNVSTATAAVDFYFVPVINSAVHFKPHLIAQMTL